MAEIDLIPAAYRIKVWLQTWLVRMGTGLAGVIVVSMAAFFYLASLNRDVDEEISQLQSRQEISNRQRDEIKQLQGKKSGLESQLALLTELRSGAAAADIFVTLDSAVTDGDVWFLDWEFQRAGSKVRETDTGVNTGYFIIVQDDSNSQAQEAWKIETHMNIRGQAKDHSALSGFVRRLFDRPEIRDVRILDTTRDRNGQMVEFRLAVIINSKAVNS